MTTPSIRPRTPRAFDIQEDYSASERAPVCLHQNRFFRMMYNGRLHYLDMVSQTNGAVVVPRFADGDLLLVRLRRAPAAGLSLEFPRGGLEPGESVVTGALRELREETGYGLSDDAGHNLGEIAADTATINAVISVVSVQIPAGTPPGPFDRNEIDGVVRMPVRRFEHAVKGGLIVDGVTMAAWLKWLLSRI